MKLEDINGRVNVQVTTLTDRNPKMRSVSIMTLERIDGVPTASVVAGHPGSYAVSAPSARPFDIDQAWLDQRSIKSFATPQLAAAESIKMSTLNMLIEEVGKKNGFHLASFNKHDVDSAKGRLEADPAHRLHIAKLEKPFSIELQSGRTVPVSHISNIGELIYKAEGLKSLPYEKVPLGEIDRLATAVADGGVKFAPAIETQLSKNKEKALVRESSQSPSPSM